jgi:protein-S-isoprenylcysteine O-methyltransferase Ste14
VVIATAVALISALFITWAMRSNPFFSSTVRIQQERGHQVVSAGPYRWMRHPGYVGVVFHYLAMPLVFGSLWAYLPVALLFVITVIRTALEDRTLQSELPGYREYAQSVRYRLLPGVW